MFFMFSDNKIKSYLIIPYLIGTNILPKKKIVISIFHLFCLKVFRSKSIYYVFNIEHIIQKGYTAVHVISFLTNFKCHTKVCISFYLTNINSAFYKKKN